MLLQDHVVNECATTSFCNEPRKYIPQIGYKLILTYLFYSQVLSSLLDEFDLITNFTEPCVIHVVRDLGEMFMTNILLGYHPFSSRAS